jgi:hypothetical protein
MTEQKHYEATIRVQLPGNTKVTEYPIFVTAENPVDATQKVIDSWKEATEPKDIRIKENAKVIVGS